MKQIKLLFTITLLTVSILVVCSCKKEFLEITPTDQLSDITIFSDQNGADVFLNDIYNSLPDQEVPSFNYDPFENYGDNAIGSFKWAMSWVLAESKSYGPANYNPGLYNHLYPAIPFIYDYIYIRIRKCNFFIEKLNENASQYPDDWREKRIAEARFLRSFFYHEAWMAYGGIPIVTEPLNLVEQGDSIFKPRSTFEETYNFMVNELDEVEKILPNEQGGGRATQGSALALKGWIELFAHHYEESVNTYRKLIALGTYSLFPDYNDQFLYENNNNSESIFAYQHKPGKPPGGYLAISNFIFFSASSYRSGYFGPKGTFGGWGQMQPTQSLIDDYLMDNGLPIDDPNSKYDPTHPYDHREKRFNQSIIHHGSVFAGTTFNMAEGGEFARDPGKDNNTGYFRRKGIDERLKGRLDQEGANYNYFRYAEALLSLAEAKIELGQIDNEAINAIDEVRIRNGLPTLANTYNRVLSQAEMRAIIRRERRVELAFENKRYWDLIRWQTAKTILNQPAYGVDIKDNNGNLTVTKVVAQNKQFFDKNYLFPLYQGWIDANPLIKAQNGGPDNWVNGQNPGY